MRPGTSGCNPTLDARGEGGPHGVAQHESAGQEGHTEMAVPHVIGHAADGEIELSDGWDLSNAATHAAGEGSSEPHG